MYLSLTNYGLCLFLIIDLDLLGDQVFAYLVRIFLSAAKKYQVLVFERVKD